MGRKIIERRNLFASNGAIYLYASLYRLWNMSFEGAEEAVLLHANGHAPATQVTS